MYRKILFVTISVIFTNLYVPRVQAASRIQKTLQVIFQKFESGKYLDTIKYLNNVERKLNPKSKNYNKYYGLISYWKAMSYSRLNEFDLAETFFIKALEFNYMAENLYYEYGQVLYVSLKYRRARIAFKKSYEQGYKKAISLYYIAFISQELKDYKKAVRFYNMIEKLNDDEKKEVVQAARMQIGDIYLKQIESRPEPFSGVKNYVIPQYEHALDYDEKSQLADQIRTKIENLQRKYEILLFQMRNGKPTSRPPYYLRANFLYGIDNNVTTLSDDSKSSASSEDYESSYYQVGFYSRYSFYPSSSFSYAPELSASYTQYNSDSTSIFPYNKYYIKSALKMNYEHMYNGKPATFFTDLDYTYTADDADADESLASASNTYGITFSEEVQFWQNNPSTFRFRYENLAAEEETSSSTSMSLSYEQVVILKWMTLFFYNNYTQTTYPDNDTVNTTAITNRVDAILPSFYKLFNPTLYLSRTATTYTEDTDRGTPSLMTYGINLNRPLSGKFYLMVDFSMSSQSADSDDDNYSKQVLTFNINYIY